MSFVARFKMETHLWMIEVCDSKSHASLRASPDPPADSMQLALERDVQLLLLADETDPI